MSDCLYDAATTPTADRDKDRRVMTDFLHDAVAAPTAGRAATESHAP